MSDTVIIALGPLGTLKLPREIFEQYLRQAPERPAASAAPERWLNSRELSSLTGIGDTTLEQMAARGQIPCIRIGRALRFIASEVEAELRHDQGIVYPRRARKRSQATDSTDSINGRYQNATER